MDLPRPSSVAERILCAVLCAGTVTAAVRVFSAEDSRSTSAQAVYYDGKTIQMQFVPGKNDFRIGPWNIRTKIQYDRPRDRHPNLYIVAPGTQYLWPGFEQYAHNEIVSSVPSKGEPVDWDVYFAVVLDPALNEDFKSEQQLILATQEEFVPGPEMKIDEMPSSALLKENLHFSTLADLDGFRRPDGSLPKLIIVPAKMSVRASAIDPDAPPEVGVQSRAHTVPSVALRH